VRRERERRERGERRRREGEESERARRRGVVEAPGRRGQIASVLVTDIHRHRHNTHAGEGTGQTLSYKSSGASFPSDTTRLIASNRIEWLALFLFAMSDGLSRDKIFRRVS